MRTAWWLLLVVACKGGAGQRDGVLTTLSDKGITYENFELTFKKDGLVDLSFTIRDPNGKEVKQLDLLSPYPPDAVELMKSPAPDLMKDPNAEREVLCRGSLSPDEWKLDATQRLHLEGALRDGNRDCNQALLEDGYTGKYFVHFYFGYSEANTEVTKVDLPDNRVAKFPALDAELDKLDKAIKAIDVKKTYPPCKATHVMREVNGKKAVPLMPGTDQRLVDKPLVNPMDALWWTQSDLFDDTDRYRKRKHAAPESLLQLWGMAPLVLVYIPTNEKMAVVREKGAFDSAEYDARAIVIDRNAGGPICEVAFQARNSTKIDYTVREEHRGAAVKTLDDDMGFQLKFDLQAQISRSANAAIQSAAL